MILMLEILKGTALLEILKDTALILWVFHGLKRLLGYIFKNVYGRLLIHKNARHVPDKNPYGQHISNEEFYNNIHRYFSTHEEN